jgi:hypothetical protein
MLKALALPIASAVLFCSSATHSLAPSHALVAPMGGKVAGDVAGETASSGDQTGEAAPAAPASPQPAAVARAGGERREPGKHLAGGRGIFYLPSDLTMRDGVFDLVIHFHGANSTTEPRFDAQGLNAVLYSINVGIGSGKYEALFPDSKALDRFLAEAEDTLRKRAPGFASARIGRVALSAWSAGYGAVFRVLAHPAAADRVDAVLLADAPHTGFQPGTRQVSQVGLAPYVNFGRRAVAGEKLMVVTHSQIETPDYASTTRTARALVASLGMPEGEPETADNPKMVMYERADLGNAHVFGFTGGDAPAHCQHLYNIGRHLWSFLGARWSENSAAPERVAQATDAADRPAEQLALATNPR